MNEHCAITQHYFHRKYTHYKQCHPSTLKSKKSKVLPKPYGPYGGTDLRFLGPQPDTSFYTVRPWIRGQCIVRYACLRPSFHWFSLRLPKERWPGWVDLGAWLRTKMVTHPNINRAWCWLTSLIQWTTLPTEPDHHLHWKDTFSKVCNNPKIRVSNR